MNAEQKIRFLVCFFFYAECDGIQFVIVISNVCILRLYISPIIILGHLNNLVAGTEVNISNNLTSTIGNCVNITIFRQPTNRFGSYWLGFGMGKRLDCTCNSINSVSFHIFRARKTKNIKNYGSLIYLRNKKTNTVVATQ